MSKNINVNPNHYKVAGRERQGENVIHSNERRTLARLRREERLIHPYGADANAQAAPGAAKSARPAAKPVRSKPGGSKAGGSKAGRSKEGRSAAGRSNASQSKAGRSTTDRVKKEAAAPRVRRAGISNRESPDAEARERRQHPPVQTSSPPPEDAAGRVGEEPLDDRRDRHTSHKAGSRSIAQKEAEARYPDRSMPAARKVAGAFGREPQRIPAVNSDSSGALRRARPKRTSKGKRSR